MTFKTDHEKLMEMYAGVRRGRGCGKTLAICHIIAGLCEIGDQKHIHVALSYMRDCFHFERQLWEVLEEHGLSFQKCNSYRLLVNGPAGQIIIFFHGEQDPNLGLGASKGYLVDGRRRTNPAINPTVWVREGTWSRL